MTLLQPHIEHNCSKSSCPEWTISSHYQPSFSRTCASLGKWSNSRLFPQRVPLGDTRDPSFVSKKGNLPHLSGFIICHSHNGVLHATHLTEGFMVNMASRRHHNHSLLYRCLCRLNISVLVGTHFRICMPHSEQNDTEKTDMCSMLWNINERSPVALRVKSPTGDVTCFHILVQVNVIEDPFQVDAIYPQVGLEHAGIPHHFYFSGTYLRPTFLLHALSFCSISFTSRALLVMRTV